MQKSCSQKVRLTCCFRLFLPMLLVIGAAGQSSPRVTRFINAATVSLTVGGQSAELQIGDHLGDWTLMQIIETNADRSEKYAILEQYRHCMTRVVSVGLRATRIATETLQP